MLLKLLIISAVLLIISFSFLGIGILIKKHGKFPNTHISQNEEMRKRGITCAQHNDIGCNPADDFPGCSTCGAGNLHGKL
jgi:hypothetical protein